MRGSLQQPESVHTRKTETVSKEMSTWRMYLFSLMAVCYIGGCTAFPVGTKETPTTAPVSFDYAAERNLGKYTGPW